MNTLGEHMALVLLLRYFSMRFGIEYSVTELHVTELHQMQFFGTPAF